MSRRLKSKIRGGEKMGKKYMDGKATLEYLGFNPDICKIVRSPMGLRVILSENEGDLLAKIQKIYDSAYDEAFLHNKIRAKKLNSTYLKASK